MFHAKKKNHCKIMPIFLFTQNRTITHSWDVTHRLIKCWHILTQRMIHSDLWYANWHRNRCFSGYCKFHQSVSLHQYTLLTFSMSYNLHKGQHH